MTWRQKPSVCTLLLPVLGAVNNPMDVTVCYKDKCGEAGSTMKEESRSKANPDTRATHTELTTRPENDVAPRTSDRYKPTPTHAHTRSHTQPPTHTYTPCGGWLVWECGGVWVLVVPWRCLLLSCCVRVALFVISLLVLAVLLAPPDFSFVTHTHRHSTPHHNA